MKNKRLLTAAASAAAIALYCMKPNDNEERLKRLKAFENRRIAHRGLHDNKTDAPENSLAAFAKAIQGGYGIELDVRLSKDGIPVVIHDATLRRVAGVNQKIAGLTFGEIRSYPLFQSEERVPSFQEALKLIDGKVPLVIEIKSGDDDEALCKSVIAELKDYRGDYCIISFSPFVLRWFKKNAPDVLRGQLSMDFFDPWKQRKESCLVKFAQTNLMTNCISKPDFIAYEFKGAEKLPLIMSRKLFHAITAAWTIRNEEELKYADRYFDIVVFEGFLPDPIKTEGAEWGE